MGIHDADFRPAQGEPPVQHPQLRAFVDAARARPVVPVELDAETLHAAWAEHRGRRRRMIGVGLAAAASIALVVGVLLPSGGTEPASPSDSSSLAEVTPAPFTAEPGLAPVAEVPPSDATPRLAQRIEVSALDEGAEPPEILGSHRLRLPPGSWSVETRVSEVVEVVVPGRTLELRGGHVHVVVAGDVARVEVLRAEVVEIDAAGHRLVREVEAEVAAEVAADPAPSRRASPSAEDLAREAESHMAAGRRGEAIKSLRRLVTRHPRSAAAQAGLIDLGRLLERSGQPDRARCAYSLFLDRWPSHSLRSDVAAAQRRLGEGPGCRGLRPRR